MTKFIIDSSAWIEYLNGSERGDKLKKYFERNELFTTSVCVAEVIAKVIREGHSTNIAEKAIHSNSTIINIDFLLAVEAGKTYITLRKTKPKIALSNAISLVVAQKISGKVITFDKDFANLPEAIVLS